MDAHTGMAGARYEMMMMAPAAQRAFITPASVTDGPAQVKRFARPAAGPAHL